MGKRTDFYLRWFSAFLLIAGCCWMIPHGDFRHLGIVPQFWLGATIMSVGFILSWWLQSISAAWFWGVAIATRLCLLAMYPGDDIWRYLWEGHIQLLGFSPYHLAPDALELLPHRTDWWPLINHPDISAIYPPITQWGFRLLAAIAPKIWLFKLAFTVADLGICWSLSRRFGHLRTLLYAWNPLVIYSFAGGGHYDSWFLLPLVMAWLMFEPAAAAPQKSDRQPSAERRWGLSALLLGISIAVKWISLPMLAFILWQTLKLQPQTNKEEGGVSPLYKGELRGETQHVGQSIFSSVKSNFPLSITGLSIKLVAIALLCSTLPLLITALPFCQVDSCPLIPASSRFVSYGRSADLVPYLVQLIWLPSLKENWLYGFPLGLWVMWLLVRSRTLLQFTEAYFIGLLLLSPVIHAWYFTWLVPFAVASRNVGIRLVSFSAFIYFVLQQRFALEETWQLTPMELFLFWGPLILGWLWSTWKTE